MYRLTFIKSSKEYILQTNSYNEVAYYLFGDITPVRLTEQRRGYYIDLTEDAIYVNFYERLFKDKKWNEVSWDEKKSYFKYLRKIEIGCGMRIEGVDYEN